MIQTQLHEFILYLSSEKGVAHNTVLAYTSDAERFASFLQKSGLQSFSEAGEELFIQYLAELKSKGYAPSSLCRSLMALKVLFRFLMREKWISCNPAMHIESPKLWQLIPEVLSKEEVAKLITTPEECDFIGARDRAILEVLYATGIRVSELCTLAIYDVDDNFVKVRGKGDKERIVPISSRAISSVDRYLSYRDAFESEKNHALFVDAKGKRVDRISIWKMIKKRGKQAGIAKNISPHTLRHCFATHLLDNGAELRVIQEMLGHASIATTDRYTHLSQEKLKTSFYKHHPRNP